VTFKEADNMVKADGWYLHKIKGSHYHYKHPAKPGKVTIPFHRGDFLVKETVNSIRKQAGLK